MANQFRGLPLQDIPMVTGGLLACELDKLKEQIEALETLIAGMNANLNLEDDHGGNIAVDEIIKIKSIAVLEFMVALNGAIAEITPQFNITGLVGNEVLRFNAGTQQVEWADIGTLTQSTYIHNQIVPALVWTIPHGLGRYPSITVVDSGGNVVVGAEQYVDANTITITFLSAFSGKAYLN